MIDGWGFDPRVAGVLDQVAALRWPVRVSGADTIPPSGPTVVVLARGLDPAAPLAVTVALRRATARPARFLGLLDVPVLGPLLRLFFRPWVTGLENVPASGGAPVLWLRSWPPALTATFTVFSSSARRAIMSAFSSSLLFALWSATLASWASSVFTLLSSAF